MYAAYAVHDMVENTMVPTDYLDDIHLHTAIVRNGSLFTYVALVGT